MKKTLLLAAFWITLSSLFAQHKLIGFSEFLSTPNDGGLIWSINLDGSAFTVLCRLEQGYIPFNLFKGTDGIFYGIASKQLGSQDKFMLFKIKADGASFKALHEFTTTSASYYTSDFGQSFFEGTDGWLYGTIGDGKIFKLSKSGNDWEIFASQYENPKSCNVIEHSDGRLYKGGGYLQSMEKDGSDLVQETLLSATFVYPYDYCKLFKLPNGKIAGVASSTDGCLDDYTHNFTFTYDPSNGVFKSQYGVREYTILGKDGLLYFNDGMINPEDLSVTHIRVVGCPYVSGAPASTQHIKPFLQGSNGLIYGKRYASWSSNYAWNPVGWNPETGYCEMILPWKPSMGYNGSIAFEYTKYTVNGNTPGLASTMKLSPNPTSSASRINVQLNAAGPIELQVWDLMGRMVFEENTKAEKGVFSLEIPAESLKTKGLYQVVLKTEEGVTSQMLSVQ